MTLPSTESLWPAPTALPSLRPSESKFTMLWCNSTSFQFVSQLGQVDKVPVLPERGAPHLVPDQGPAASGRRDRRHGRKRLEHVLQQRKVHLRERHEVGELESVEPGVLKRHLWHQHPRPTQPGLRWWHRPQRCGNVLLLGPVFLEYQARWLMCYEL